jgi:hypothetical protein
MRTIQELFNELENHPDYIYASVWTKNDVVNNINDNLEEYLIDTFDYDEIDPEWLEKTSLQFVNDNKNKIQKIINNYEEYNYVYDSWSISFEDYEFPKYVTN